MPWYLVLLIQDPYTPTDKLLSQMEGDVDLHKTIEALRKKHDEWRAASQDINDSSKFPSVTNGPEILAMDRSEQHECLALVPYLCVYL
jgi:hypothetical protein